MTMPKITLPDGTLKHFDQAVTVYAVAESIGAGLAKAALAGKVDGQLVDVSFVIENDANLQIITAKDAEGLEIIRHSTAHLLAHAVKSLYPAAQITIGPVIEDGFYYDISFNRSLTPDDLEKIEAKMHAIAQDNHKVERKVLSHAQAVQLFADMGEHYKVEIINDIPKDEPLTAYQQGDFIDLCRGPHVPYTGALKAFKLTKLAGAYWRGDSNNEMLQRIYGTAWADKKALKAYLHRLEEAEKRDHRKLGKKMDLFHFQAEAPGMVFWHDNGWVLYQQVQNYIRQAIRQDGYQEIRTPQLVDQSLWERSGHWAKYQEEMFTTESEKRLFAIKPMNCPCHVQVFNQGIKSYRDLPIRLAEFGNCHRNEHSGTLHGLMRVRNFTQDDAHIFCTEDQIFAEMSKLMRHVMKVYQDFGFTDILVNLSTRPERRVGSDEIWDKAEHALETVLNQSGHAWNLQPGDGAFYGPKIDFTLRDCLGRLWQCGTIQLDFSMPERLGAQYVGEDGAKHTPVMIHRAILGSMERFIGVLIEHYAGKLPLWLAPVQAVIMNITDQQGEYVQKTAEKLQNLGLRVISDLRNEKIGFKIREHTISRVPYLIVAGDREVSEQTLSVKMHGHDKSQTMAVDELVKLLQQEIATKGGDKH